MVNLHAKAKTWPKDSVVLHVPIVEVTWASNYFRGIGRNAIDEMEGIGKKNYKPKANINARAKE